jgi:hypothetical protein
LSRSLRLLVLLVAVAAGCAPRARQLAGTPSVARLPVTELQGARQIVFRWSYEEGSLHAGGEGVASVAAPDSARLDLFLDGGLGGGRALLFGDSLVVLGGDGIRRFLPPPPLLWASLGRLAVPSAADTAARSEGAVLRADIGAEPRYRATFDSTGLARLERIAGGRIMEWVARTDARNVRYVNEAARRSLTIVITRNEAVEGFDASFWDH